MLHIMAILWRLIFDTYDYGWRNRFIFFFTIYFRFSSDFTKGKLCWRLLINGYFMTGHLQLCYSILLPGQETYNFKMEKKKIYEAVICVRVERLLGALLRFHCRSKVIADARCRQLLMTSVWLLRYHQYLHL